LKTQEARKNEPKTNRNEPENEPGHVVENNRPRNSGRRVFNAIPTRKNSPGRGATIGFCTAGFQPGTLLARATPLCALWSRSFTAERTESLSDLRVGAFSCTEITVAKCRDRIPAALYNSQPSPAGGRGGTTKWCVRASPAAGTCIIEVSRSRGTRNSRRGLPTQYSGGLSG
jgi:hypothetical protein